MTVKNPEELKQVTDAVLNGLTATNDLKAKIVYAAAQQKTKPVKESGSSLLRFVPVICCCLAVVVCLSALIPQMRNATTETTILPAITDMPAGNIHTENGGTPRTGTLISSEGRGVSSGRGVAGIFSDKVPNQEDNQEEAASEPKVIVLDGRFYRLLDGLFDSDRLGISSTIATISLCDSYLNLSDAKSGSTFLKEGTEIHSLDGMNGAFVAAEYGEGVCVFQRISLEQHGLLNDEKIQDILPNLSHAVSLELAGKGTITNPDDIRNLMALLCDNATAESNNPLNTGEYMILHLDNGLMYQFTLNQQRISFCGTWLCPEFMELLESLL